MHWSQSQRLAVALAMAGGVEMRTGDELPRLLKFVKQQRLWRAQLLEASVSMSTR
jgi:hypothetical protein